ncbi:hypothetical protein [Streptomyces sp. NPDC093568]|uniref:hypothetical protein n=1 Tax=Streptomyces sp. NPDC093568 TaxID=3366041 RepID=UPI0038014B31
MVALLAVVAVVGYMAKAGLPWWVVAAVALLTAGFAAGVSGGPARGTRSAARPGPADQPTMGFPEQGPTAPPVSVNTGPDDWDAPASTDLTDSRALR